MFEHQNVLWCNTSYHSVGCIVPYHSASELLWTPVYAVFWETLHENTIQYSEFCVIKQLQVFQVHTHWCICFLFFWLPMRRGLHDPAGILPARHILKPGLVGWVFLPWKFANPPHTACTPASPAVTDCLRLQLQGSRGLEKTFPFELCFCGLELLLHLLSPPQPPS